MRYLYDISAIIALTLWIGGMWAIGFIVTPALFHVIPTQMVAGMVAGRLFRLTAWMGMACGGWLILYRLIRSGTHAFRQGSFWLIVAILTLTIIGQYYVAPVLHSLKHQALPLDVMQSVFRSRFSTWHGVANLLFIIQSLLGVWLISKQATLLK
ncbi:MAG: DUF4149 domain-containing protein [Proteobacteria bacterium]|nr:DUF4149 domain-containing protein [Pseudomonadota bacterium]MDE3208287.1 DUF4149 domain-containing protein [Pseudomonadota bacterium]